MDFWDSYQKIASKTKKRFLRKPNLTDASSEYEELAKQMSRKDKKSYAAFCYLAVSRCEEAMQNSTSQANAAVEAARLFWESERELSENSFSSDGSSFGFEEYAREATDCYLLAIDLYMKNSQVVMCYQLYMELANILKELKRYSEAVMYFEKSAEIQSEYTHSAYLPIHCYLCSFECQIEMRDFIGALSTTAMIIEIGAPSKGKKNRQIPPSRSDFLKKTVLECEIARIFIYLLEGYDPITIKFELERISYFKKQVDSVEPPVWSSTLTSKVLLNNFTVKLDQETSILVESVVVAYKNSNLKALYQLEKLLSPLLSKPFKDLLALVVKSKDASVKTS